MSVISDKQSRAPPTEITGVWAKTLPAFTEELTVVQSVKSATTSVLKATKSWRMFTTLKVATSADNEATRVAKVFKSERQVRKSKETGTFYDFSVKRDARVALVIPQSFKAASIIGSMVLISSIKDSTVTLEERKLWSSVWRAETSEIHWKMSVFSPRNFWEEIIEHESKIKVTNNKVLVIWDRIWLFYWRVLS